MTLLETDTGRFCGLSGCEADWLSSRRHELDTDVQSFFNKLKHFRGVATRYDKRAENCLAGVQLASLRIWLRANESMA